MNQSTDNLSETHVGLEMSRSEESLRILKKVVLDGFLFSLLGVGIYITTHVWQPFKRGFFCGDESLMFPYKDDTVPSNILQIVGITLPSLTIIICEYILLRNHKEDKYCLSIRIPAWLRGAYCTLVSFCLGVIFMELTANIAKKTIGRPRPHFFELCQPSIDCSAAEWRGRYIQYNEYHCLGTQREKFSDMRMSFLSGHSAWAAYTMLYLTLYLEKRMVWRGTRVLRHTLQFAALMLSWFTALSRVSDYKHHWSDVLAGYFLGFAVAVLVWIWGTDLVEPKKKHSLLPQHDVALETQPTT